MPVPVVGVDVVGVLSKYDVFALVLEVLHFLCVEAALTLTSVMCICVVICLTSVTRAKCGVCSTLCENIANISGSTELFAL